MAAPVVGPVTFDENGDTSQKIVSVYAVDPAAGNGTGDWILKEEVSPLG